MKKTLPLVLYVLCALTGCAGPRAGGILLSLTAALAVDDSQSFLLTAFVNQGGVKWSLTGPGALSGQTATSVTYTAPASGAGTATITATSTADTTTTATLTVTVSSPPVITTTSLPNVVLGTAYSQTIAASGGAGTLTFTLSAGTLPLGLSLSSAGAITGTPTSVGKANFTVKATDASSVSAQSVTQAFSITVNQAPTITSANALTAVVGTAGTFTVTTTGIPTPSLMETGALPSGVTFTDNGNGTGTLGGTPAAGTGKTYLTTFTASNGVGSGANQSFTLTVDEAPGITSPNTAAFTVGASASFIVTTTGFPAPALTETGALPSGVTFTNNGNGTGTLSGTPAAGTAGAFPITFTASNGVGTPANQSVTLTVNTAAVITSASSTTFTVGTAGTFAVTTTGTPTPSLTETGTLPNGVTFKDNGNGTGTLSGTPAAASAGSYSIAFTASDGVGTPAAQVFTLTVNIAPVITSASSTTFTVGTAGTFAVTTTGTPTPSLTETGTLPSGVTFKDNGNGTGTLTGTPAAATAGSYPITFTATNGVGTPASQSFTLTVNTAPVITSASSTTFTVSTAGTFAVTTTGTPTPSLTETGALPSGVTFTNNGNGTGTLSGTPAAASAGSYSITFTASNGVGTPAAQVFTLTVSIAPVITSASSTTFIVGTPGTFSVTMTGTPTPSLTETGALPSGVTFKDNGNGTGTLSGTAAAGTSGSYPITFTATNGVGTPASQSFTLTVNTAPVITSGSSTTFTVSTAGTFAVTTTGTPTPSLTETGTLPSGVSFKDNGNGTGTLSGTSAAGTGGAYSITIKATSTSGSTSQPFTLTVNQAPAITSATGATFTVGTSGLFAVIATGFPAPALTETGALPSGMAFADNGNGTGKLVGIPAVGTGRIYPVTFTASNGVGSGANQSFTITVDEAPGITSPNTTAFTAGTSGSFTVMTAGFPAPALTETGALPSGVTFANNGNGTGTLSGTPAAGTVGTYTITFAATNGVGTPASQTFTLTVNTASAAPVVTSASNTIFTAGTSGTFSVTTTGTPTPSLTETGTLPTGLTFKDNGSGTGTLAGTAASGTGKTYSLTFTASNGVGSGANQSFTLTVNEAPAIISPNSTTLTAGTSASFTVMTTGYPTASLTETGALPSGVTFANNGNGAGTLSGTPAAGTAGSYPITFTATNGVGTAATQTFTLTVNTASTTPVITSASSTTFTVGTAGTFSVTTTGAPTPSLTETGPLPSGVTLKDNGNGTGTLSGTPAAGTGGTYSITIEATNTAGNTSQSFTLTVNQVPAITSANSSMFAVGTAGTFTVTATGFPTASLTETGALPSGVTFVDNGNGTGTLSGTPTAGTAGAFPITFTATNGSGTPATQTFTLTVSAVSIACGSGHESVLKGQYAFLFQGFDANGPMAIAGTFSADGTGKVALLAGVEDVNRSAAVQTNIAINSALSSYSVGSDNRGCLTIATSSGTSKYALSLGSLNTSSVAARGRMIETDSTGTLGSGVLRLQDPTAFSTAPSGSFIFDGSSTLSLSTTTPNRFVLMGSLAAAGGAITSGEADFNLSGSVDGGAAGPLAITGGSYSVSSNGRGTLGFTVAGAGTFNNAIYIISATEFYFMNSVPQSAANPLFAGTAQSQTGPFSTSSMSGNSVFYRIGLCGGCGPSSTVAPDLSLGVINVPAAGSFTLTADQNQGGTLTPQSFSGTYTVDSSGRVVLQAGVLGAYIVYLQTSNRGYLLSTGSDVGEGSIDGQSAGPFTTASLNGAFFLGTTDQTEQNVSDNSGVASFDGLGTVSGTTDSVSLGFPPSSNTFSQSYSVTNGTGTPGRGTVTASGVTSSIFYITSASKIVMMDVMNNSGMPNPNPAITAGRK